jgi:hypothetical protein
MADATVTDPLGRAIVLHEGTWFGHILRRHPEMRGTRPQVEQTIRQPREIRLSTYDADCRTCYSDIVRAGMMIAVVIDVRQALVRTAFYTTRPRGDIEWSRPIP